MNIYYFKCNLKSAINVLRQVLIKYMLGRPTKPETEVKISNDNKYFETLVLTFEHPSMTKINC
jgi:hypothetical protein